MAKIYSSDVLLKNGTNTFNNIQQVTMISDASCLQIDESSDLETDAGNFTFTYNEGSLVVKFDEGLHTEDLTMLYVVEGIADGKSKHYVIKGNKMIKESFLHFTGNQCFTSSINLSSVTYALDRYIINEQEFVPSRTKHNLQGMSNSSNSPDDTPITLGKMSIDETQTISLRAMNDGVAVIVCHFRLRDGTKTSQRAQILVHIDKCIPIPDIVVKRNDKINPYTIPVMKKINGRDARLTKVIYDETEQIRADDKITKIAYGQVEIDATAITFEFKRRPATTFSIMYQVGIQQFQQDVYFEIEQVRKIQNATKEVPIPGLFAFNVLTNVDSGVGDFTESTIEMGEMTFGSDDATGSTVKVPFGPRFPKIEKSGITVTSSGDVNIDWKTVTETIVTVVLYGFDVVGKFEITQPISLVDRLETMLNLTIEGTCDEAGVMNGFLDMTSIIPKTLEYDIIPETGADAGVELYDEKYLHVKAKTGQFIVTVRDGSEEKTYAGKITLKLTDKRERKYVTIGENIITDSCSVFVVNGHIYKEDAKFDWGWIFWKDTNRDSSQNSSNTSGTLVAKIREYAVLPSIACFGRSAACYEMYHKPQVNDIYRINSISGQKVSFLVSEMGFRDARSSFEATVAFDKVQNENGKLKAEKLKNGDYHIVYTPKKITEGRIFDEVPITIKIDGVSHKTKLLVIGSFMNLTFEKLDFAGYSGRLFDNFKRRISSGSLRRNSATATSTDEIYEYTIGPFSAGPDETLYMKSGHYCVSSDAQIDFYTNDLRYYKVFTKNVDQDIICHLVRVDEDAAEIIDIVGREAVEFSGRTISRLDVVSVLFGAVKLDSTSTKIKIVDDKFSYMECDIALVPKANAASSPSSPGASPGSATTKHLILFNAEGSFMDNLSACVPGTLFPYDENKQYKIVDITCGGEKLEMKRKFTAASGAIFYFFENGTYFVVPSSEDTEFSCRYQVLVHDETDPTAESNIQTVSQELSPTTTPNTTPPLASPKRKVSSLTSPMSASLSSTSPANTPLKRRKSSVGFREDALSQSGVLDTPMKVEKTVTETIIVRAPDVMKIPSSLNVIGMRMPVWVEDEQISESFYYPAAVGRQTLKSVNGDVLIEVTPDECPTLYIFDQPSCLRLDRIFTIKSERLHCVKKVKDFTYVAAMTSSMASCYIEIDGCLIGDTKERCFRINLAHVPNEMSIMTRKGVFFAMTEHTVVKTDSLATVARVEANKYTYSTNGNSFRVGLSQSIMMTGVKEPIQSFDVVQTFMVEGFDTKWVAKVTKRVELEGAPLDMSTLGVPPTLQIRDVKLDGRAVQMPTNKKIAIAGDGSHTVTFSVEIFDFTVACMYKTPIKLEVDGLVVAYEDRDHPVPITKLIKRGWSKTTTVEKASADLPGEPSLRGIDILLGGCPNVAVTCHDAKYDKHVIKVFIVTTQPPEKKIIRRRFLVGREFVIREFEEETPSAASAVPTSITSGAPVVALATPAAPQTPASQSASQPSAMQVVTDPIKTKVVVMPDRKYIFNQQEGREYLISFDMRVVAVLYKNVNITLGQPTICGTIIPDCSVTYTEKNIKLTTKNRLSLLRFTVRCVENNEEREFTLKVVICPVGERMTKAVIDF